MKHVILFLAFVFFASTIPLLMKSAYLSSHGYMWYDAGPPPTKGRLKLTFEMGHLKQERFDHGTFFFGPNSHEVEFVSSYDPPLNSIQKEFLDDEIIDVEREKERCARYGYGMVNETHPKRRRLFLGGLLGDESMEVLQAVGMEVYDMFHTVSFIEGNTAHNLSPRNWKYYDPNQPSEKLNALYQMYGPKTKVSVDYYNTTMTHLAGDELFLHSMQKEGITLRWALHGMREDDVAVMHDADEIFTRDFLRAMQICDVAEFRTDQDCRVPKVIASTAVFESSPECVRKDKRWHHPDALLGKCVEHTGNSSLHPPTKRQYADKHGMRLKGYGADPNDYSKYVADGLGPMNTFPLWHGTDMRSGAGGRIIKMANGSPTGYHFHNFFMNADEVRNKYATYGHARSSAKNLPLWEIHEDLKLAVDCAHGQREYTLDFNNTGSSVLPIYYLNDEARDKRHRFWRSIVKEEEERWGNRTK